MTFILLKIIWIIMGLIITIMLIQLIGNSIYCYINKFKNRV